MTLAYFKVKPTFVSFAAVRVEPGELGLFEQIPEPLVGRHTAARELAEGVDAELDQAIPRDARRASPVDAGGIDSPVGTRQIVC